MRTHRIVTGALLALLLAVGAARPAAGHEEISPAEVPTGKAVFLTLLAANETRSALTRITVTAPTGVEFGAATRQPAGWTAERSPTAITWTGGTLAPGTFEQWGFEVEAIDQPGPLRFRVASGYAGGGSDTHSVEIVAVAPGPSGTTVPSPVTTVTTTPAEAPDTTEPVTTNADADSSSRETAALALAGVALVLALVALAAALRGGRRAGPAEARDW